jgi:[acyl-carrier-protein] S-malonyltransferase
MGTALVTASPAARELMSRANDLLGVDLLEVMANGPEDLLNSTRISQPAIFLVSLAALEALEERSGARRGLGRGLAAAATAGLSLGEYTALVFAGSLELDAALDAVVARGRFMQEACDETAGGMVSLLGLDPTKVEEAVRRGAERGRVGIASFNSPEQTVISGEAAALERAGEAARELGCRRALPLRVAGAYHSPLMAAATRKLLPRLQALAIRPPRVPFYANVTGERVDDPAEIRAGLLRQVENTVHWVSTVQRIAAAGVTEAVEVGPGTVIRGLVRKIDPRVAVTSVCDPEGMADLQL